MYYLYVLQSKKDNEFYTGFTSDLDRRIEEHNKGYQVSTRHRVPLELIYYEWCLSKSDAVDREQYLKSGRGKKYLKTRLKGYLEDLELGGVPRSKFY